MHQKKFIFLLALFAVATILLHLYPLLQNKFYFTMDQGRDAIYVRELLTRGKILTIGPATSIEGVYHGVGWYYLIAIGMGIFTGHPVGAVWSLIGVHILAFGFLLWKLKNRLSFGSIAVIGIGLLTFWPWYESSSYTFNPFLLTPLALIATLLLTETTPRNSKNFIWAAIPVGLSFHAHILGALCLTLWYAAVGVVLAHKKYFSISTIAKGIGIVGIFLLPHFLTEIFTKFPQWQALIKEFTTTKEFFGTMAPVETFASFVNLLGISIIPFSAVAGIIVSIITFSLYIRKKEKDTWQQQFIFLSLGLWTMSLLFFLTNASWRSWVTMYLPPLLFVSMLCMMESFRTILGKGLLVIFILIHVFYFGNRYLSINDNDPSLLTNELRAIDWAYEKAKGTGFNSYHYLPSVLDYPYQYLYAWHGRKAYGYVPCEYASFPGSPKLFVPGKKYYETPTKDCNGLTFLIIEPNREHANLREDWMKQLHKLFVHQESTNIGNILVEMRQANSTQNK
jgi:hypothetical protein